MSDEGRVRLLTLEAKDQHRETRALARAEVDANRRRLTIDEASLPTGRGQDQLPDEAGCCETAGIPVVCPHCQERRLESRKTVLHTRNGKIWIPAAQDFCLLFLRKCPGCLLSHRARLDPRC